MATTATDHFSDVLLSPSAAHLSSLPNPNASAPNLGHAPSPTPSTSPARTGSLAPSRASEKGNGPNATPRPASAPTLVGLDDKGGVEKDNTPPIAPAEDSGVKSAPNGKPKLSQRHKWSLLAMFSLGFFIDVWCYSAFFIFTAPITKDLSILFEQQVWVITSYAVTFASFLLFWGRLSDLYSATPVFQFGFTALGILSIATSFLPEKYSFFILRALSGIAGSTLIPASYRLIAYVFEPHELTMAFTLYGMTGAIANVTGTLIAGVVCLIPNGGQGAPWRWFFRILGILILPVAAISFFVVPYQHGEDPIAADIDNDVKNASGDEDEGNNGPHSSKSDTPKWHRLDLIGSLIILSATVLLILGLTLGASYGWRKAKFLVPFLLSFVLFPLFFVWEARLPQTHALIPTKTWRIPNFTLFIVFVLQIYPWWAINFLALVETFVNVHGEKPILAAARVLPEGIIAFILTIVVMSNQWILARPRWPIALGCLGGVVGYILFTRPADTDHYVGKYYWRFVFPAMLIGSGGNVVAFHGANVTVMSTVPPNMAGVAGAALQVAFQVGTVIGFSIQAGLMTVNPGGITNADNMKASFYFQLGWAAVWLIGFLAWYRQPKAPATDSEADPAAPTNETDPVAST